MPIPIIAAALLWAAAGAVAGVAVGYVIDHSIGDGNYTRTEIVVDATTGALGLSVLRAGAKALGGLRYATGAMKLEKAGDAADAIRAGFAVARSGVAEIYTIRGLDLAITAAMTPGQSAAYDYGGTTDVGVVSRKPKKPGKSPSKPGVRGTIRKTWCKRHRQYDLCR